VVAAALLSLLLGPGGCSDGGNDPAAPAGDPGVTAVSYAAEVQPIWDANCLGCHGAGGSGGLDLRAAVGRAALVNVAATGYPGARVVPGDPHLSVLYRKIEGDPATGTRMPFGGAALSAGERLLIHDWIEQGALNN
jgi:mono/diheme cytochrome c family protein